MKPTDPGYKRKLKSFNMFHYIIYVHAHPKSCVYLQKRAGEWLEAAECPHQTGWVCCSPENPGNIKLEDLVLEEL